MKSLWGAIVAGLRVLWNRPGADAELDEEVRHYYDLTVQSHIARGMSTTGAQRAARAEFGSVVSTREQVRTHGWEHLVDTVFQDLRYGWRRLRAAPGFSAVAIVTIALGVGASTAIFSVVHPVLIASLPYPHADRLVVLEDRLPDGTAFPMTFGNYRELVARAHALESIAGSGSWQPTLVLNDRPERIAGQSVTANYFATLGVRPLLGRDFDPADDYPEGRRTVILSYGLWRRAFGSDSGIVGRSVRLNDSSFIVAGVMPRNFESVPGSRADVWTLLRLPLTLPSEGRQWGHNLRVIARTTEGVTTADVTRDIDAVIMNPIPEFARPPWATMRGGLRVSPLQTDATRATRAALLALAGAVTLVLLIACVNVANLVLSRASHRRGEMAMRSALGAGRARIVRQVLTESLLLSAIGGALGVLAARASLVALVAMAPSELPRVGAIGVDGTALLFAIGVVVVAGVAIGMAPALSASAEGSAGAGGTQTRVSSRGMGRRWLIVAEMALSTALLVNVGLLWRSVEKLFAVNPGFDARDVVTLRMSLAGPRYETDSMVFGFFDAALAAARAVPGVQSAALVSQLPLSGDDDRYGAHFESSPTGRDEGSVVRFAVSPGYFSAMRIPILRGRPIEAIDDANAPFAMVLNASFAARKFPRQDPIGQRLRIGPDRGQWYTIVGIAGDVRQQSLAGDVADAAYISTKQSWFADSQLWLVARTNAAGMPQAIRSAVWSVDNTQGVDRVGTMREVVNASAATRRFALMVFQVFAAVALLLAATGLYGVLMAAVNARRQEIGVRAAIGANKSRILMLVVGEVAALSAAGIALGLMAGAATSTLLRSLFFGVTAADAVTYVGVVVVLALTGAIGCAVPAIRAANVEPTLALRADA